MSVIQKLVELLVCKRAIELATELGINKLVMDTDCVGVGSKLLDIGMDRSEYDPIVMEIKQMMQNVRRCGSSGRPSNC